MNAIAITKQQLIDVIPLLPDDAGNIRAASGYSRDRGDYSFISFSTQQSPPKGLWQRAGAEHNRWMIILEQELGG